MSHHSHPCTVPEWTSGSCTALIVFVIVALAGAPVSRRQPALISIANMQCFVCGIENYYPMEILCAVETEALTSGSCKIIQLDLEFEPGVGCLGMVVGKPQCRSPFPF